MPATLRWPIPGSAPPHDAAKPLEERLHPARRTEQIVGEAFGMVDLVDERRTCTLAHRQRIDARVQRLRHRFSHGSPFQGDEGEPMMRMPVDHRHRPNG
ncbi:MAG TPA: hypothetical protein VFS06_17385 [Casimicrobiaceae bacterium]|nr:hypothetical protein [Casimicrobiaceae bacterium]